MSSKLKFSKIDFQLLDLPNLLINTWEYNEPGCKNQSPVCIQYEKWCIEAAQEKWKAEYLDFKCVIENLRRQNKQFYNFGKICSANKNVIYRLIYKWCMT